MAPWIFHIGKKSKLTIKRVCKTFVIIWCALCFLTLNSLFSRTEQGIIQTQHRDESIHKQRTVLKVAGYQDEIHSRKEDGFKDSSSYEYPSDVGITPNLTLVIVVCSHSEHVQLRQTIRSTWGKDVKHLYGTEVFFLLARPVDVTWRELTRREMELHGDLVHVDIEEDYKNLAQKVIKGMKWVLLNRPDVSYYMKCDDDVYVNIPGLIRDLKDGVISSSLEILGALSPNSKVIRDTRDEWSVPYDVFPAKTFPPYMSGGGYVMPLVTLQSLIRVLPKVVKVHLEDVFVTGILAREAGVSHVSHEGFSFWTSPKAKPCDIISGRRITSVNMSAKRITKLHRQISEILLNNENSCLNETVTKDIWI